MYVSVVFAVNNHSLRIYFLCRLMSAHFSSLWDIHAIFFLETIFERIDKSESEGNRFETFIMEVFKMKVCVCPDLFILSKD